MKFICPSCRRTLNVKAEMAGGKAKCPSCQNIIAIPNPGTPVFSASCPGCGRSFKVKTEMAGRPAVCPACKAKFKIPEPRAKQPLQVQDAGPSGRSAGPSPPPLPAGARQPGQTSPERTGRGDDPPARARTGRQRTEVEPGPTSPEKNVKAQVKGEILGLISGATIIGGIVGYLYGGLYNPWREPGLASAGLNLVLFGLWAAAESFGLVGAFKTGLARSRLTLILAGGFSGGAWCGLISGLDIATDPIMQGPVIFNAAVGFITGFVICGLISALSVIRLSKIITTGEKD